MINKCNHEYNEPIIVYANTLPSDGYYDEIILWGEKIIGPQTYYKRICQNCGQVQIIWGNKANQYLELLNNEKKGVIPVLKR